MVLLLLQLAELASMKRTFTLPGTPYGEAMLPSSQDDAQGDPSTHGANIQCTNDNSASVESNITSNLSNGASEQEKF